MIDIYDIQPYQDRGIRRYKLFWRDGDASGRADSHCSITGVPLGDSYTACVAHCREYGHYSVEVNARFHEFALMRLKEMNRAKSDHAKEQANKWIDDLKEAWVASTTVYTQTQNTKPEKYATIIGTPFE